MLAKEQRNYAINASSAQPDTSLDNPFSSVSIESLKPAIEEDRSCLFEAGSKTVIRVIKAIFKSEIVEIEPNLHRELLRAGLLESIPKEEYRLAQRQLEVLPETSKLCQKHTQSIDAAVSDIDDLTASLSSRWHRLWSSDKTLRQERLERQQLERQKASLEGELQEIQPKYESLKALKDKVEGLAESNQGYVKLTEAGQKLLDNFEQMPLFWQQFKLSQLKQQIENWEKFFTHLEDFYQEPDINEQEAARMAREVTFSAASVDGLKALFNAANNVPDLESETAPSLAWNAYYHKIPIEDFIARFNEAYSSTNVDSFSAAMMSSLSLLEKKSMSVSDRSCRLRMVIFPLTM